MCWSHRDRVFHPLDLWETRSPKTRACVSTSGGMLGVVRDGNYNPIQGQIIQLCGTGGVTESARGTDSGHVVWTQSWAGWKTVACAEEEIGGFSLGHRRVFRPARGHGSTCMQRGGMDRRRRFSSGVGPTFYTSLLDGGGVVGLGLHRVAEARGGVGT